MKADINCDMGEGIGNETHLLPFITSANISCGYHAGNAAIIRDVIKACQKYNVAIGAHPSFDDRENFGRKEFHLAAPELYELITRQLNLFIKLAEDTNCKMHHVKPHGALYNLSAKDTSTARVIAAAVKDFDPALVLYGLSGSVSIHEAENIGLKTASEVFSDRTYQEDGSLTPRSHKNALYNKKEDVIRQVTEMMYEGKVTTLPGKKIPIVAETICIHGDGEHAVEFAAAVYDCIHRTTI